MYYVLVFVIYPNLTFDVTHDCMPVAPAKAHAKMYEEAAWLADTYEAQCQKRDGMYQWDCFNPRGVFHLSLQRTLEECKQTPIRQMTNLRNLMKKPTL